MGSYHVLCLPLNLCTETFLQVPQGLVTGMLLPSLLLCIRVSVQDSAIEHGVANRQERGLWRPSPRSSTSRRDLGKLVNFCEL